MSRHRTWGLRWVLVCAFLANPAPAHAALSTVRVAQGLDRPLYATAPPGDTSRLFIVEQHSGRIRILELGSGTIRGTDFLDLGGLATGSEQGLLGLAFHPDFETNGFFYVNLTVTGGDTEIRRYQVSDDPNVADPQSGQLVIGYDQPQTNHNGGWLGFGPDGYLYVGSGDGGGTNDSASGHTAGIGNAQDITSNLLGKLLRLDVDGDDFPADAARNYAVPPSNPFVGKTGDDEIWSHGLRNPWRASFDRTTGDLYIGDVGQSSREEINVQPAGSVGGENYGWRLREGTIENPVVGGPRPAGAIDPIYDYTRGDGAFQGFAVTGGYVYRGPIASIQGHYFFADYASERIWSLIYDGSAPATFDGSNYTVLTDRTAELAPGGGMAINDIASFAEDAAGNLYIVDLGGEIFRIVSDDPVTTTTTTLLVTTTTFPMTTTTLPAVTTTTTVPVTTTTLPLGTTTTTIPVTTTTLPVVTTTTTVPVTTTTLPADTTTTTTVLITTTTVPVTTTSTTTALPPGATCGDPVDSGTSGLPTAGDALFVLRTSVGTAICAPCVCDVNDSGEVTVTDALLVLRAAVGHAVELSCPAC